MPLRAMSRPATKSVAIVGAGLAGAALAHTFAKAGYAITVYEQSHAPAAGGSGVPIGLFAPSVSRDDAPHSRVLRRGVHVLLSELAQLTQAGLLAEGVDWALSGVWERCIRTSKNLPSAWLEDQDPPDLQSRVLHKPIPTWLAGRWGVEIRDIWHGAAGWVRPGRLIEAWLAHPRIELKTNAGVDDVRALQDDVVVVACGYQTARLLPGYAPQLQPIRGQVEWSNRPLRDTLDQGALPSHPVNGMGHFIPTGSGWLTGATFQRDETDTAPRERDTLLNFEKLQTLLPAIGPGCLSDLRAHAVPWAGVRVAQKNRSPLLEKIKHPGYAPVWVCTGLGSRGLSLAALCARRLLASVEDELALGQK